MIEVRTQHCLEVFEKIKHLEGNLIELGVAAGATTFPLSKACQPKLLYALDTFEGLPYDDLIDCPFPPLSRSHSGNRPRDRLQEIQGNQGFRYLYIHGEICRVRPNDPVTSAGSCPVSVGPSRSGPMRVREGMDTHGVSVGLATLLTIPSVSSVTSKAQSPLPLKSTMTHQ